MMNENNKTQAILDADPVATAEEILGKSHEEWNLETDAQTVLGLAYFTSKIKEKHLKKNEDTYFAISWKNFLEIAKKHNFKIGYSKNFIGTGWSDDGTVEEEVILFDDENGLIIYAESFDGTRVNNAKLYGEAFTNGPIEEKHRRALNGSSHEYNENGTVSFDFDIREGFVFYLNKMLHTFEFSKTWTNVPFLWFLNYMENKTEKDYEAINRRKIAESAPEVSKIIYG